MNGRYRTRLPDNESTKEKSGFPDSKQKKKEKQIGYRNLNLKAKSLRRVIQFVTYK